MPFVTLSELVEILKKDAPKLREAGVLKFSCADVTVELATYVPPIPADMQGDEDDEQTVFADPLEDPTTYGLPPGSAVPGFKRDQFRADEDDHE
jgi:hypothetical protein